jgi:hypothetical protein
MRHRCSSQSHLLHFWGLVCAVCVQVSGWEQKESVSNCSKCKRAFSLFCYRQRASPSPVRSVRTRSHRTPLLMHHSCRRLQRTGSPRGAVRLCPHLRSDSGAVVAASSSAPRVRRTTARSQIGRSVL